jgi:hypothetical protein
MKTNVGTLGTIIMTGAEFQYWWCPQHLYISSPSPSHVNSNKPNWLPTWWVAEA